MRRMLFTLAAGASAVVLLAAAVLWVRSYWVSDTLDHDTPGARVGVGSSLGRVRWARVDVRGATVTFDRSPGYHAGPAEAGAGYYVPESWSFAGFRWANSSFSFGGPV